MEGTLGSNVYGFNPEKYKKTALKLQVGDSTSRKVTLVEKISQLQYAYGSAVINDPTSGKRFHEGRLNKHCLVKDFQSDDSLNDKIVPLYPKLGMEMVNVDRNLFQKCLQQFFSR